MATRERSGPEIPVDPDLAGPDPAGRDGSGRPRDPRRRGLGGEGPVLLAVACGGALGALARYGVSLVLPATTGGFPWAVFLINVSGSVALGFLVVLLIERFPRARLARPLLGTGILGAFTTFSTYTVGAALLVRSGHPGTSVLYALSSVVAGLAGAWAGMGTARGVLGIDRVARAPRGRA